MLYFRLQNSETLMNTDKSNFVYESQGENGKSGKKLGRPSKSGKSKSIVVSVRLPEDIAREWSGARIYDCIVAGYSGSDWRVNVQSKHIDDADNKLRQLAKDHETVVKGLQEEIAGLKLLCKNLIAERDAMKKGSTAITDKLISEMDNVYGPPTGNKLFNDHNSPSKPSPAEN